MTMDAYPFLPPGWFDDYGYKPSAFYDTPRANHVTAVLGSVMGDKASFCQYGFFTMGGAPAQQWAIPIPVVHATLESAGGCLWVFGLTTSIWCWQGPVPGVAIGPSAATASAQAAALPFQPMTPELHKEYERKHGKRYGHVFNELWKQVAVPHYRALGRKDVIEASKKFDFTKHEPTVRMP